MKVEKKILNSPFSPKEVIYDGSPVGDTVYYDKKFIVNMLKQVLKNILTKMVKKISFYWCC